MEKSGLLIFDLDGTLFQAHTVTVPAVQASFRELRLPVPTEQDVHSFFGKPTAEWHAWLSSQCPPQQADELIARVDQVELELISQTGQLYPGVIEVLGKLKASGNQMAICSNGPQAYVERVVKAHNLGGFFDIIRYRESNDDGKPNMVRELLGRMTRRPGIVIGDRLDDIEAAHRNSLAAIASAYGYGAAEELANADRTAQSPSDLWHLVGSLLEPDGAR